MGEAAASVALGAARPRAPLLLFQKQLGAEICWWAQADPLESAGQDLCEAQLALPRPESGALVRNTSCGRETVRVWRLWKGCRLISRRWGERR